MEKKKSSNSAYFFGGWRLRCGRIPLSELDGGIESTEESSWLTVVDGEGVTNSDSAVSPVGGKFVPACVGSGGVSFLLEGVVVPSTGLEVRGFFDGVDAGARPSQRDRFEVGVAAGVGVAIAELGLGRYVRSRTRRARRFVSVVRPASFAVTLRKAPDGGVLTFCHRLVFSKKQTTEK